MNISQEFQTEMFQKNPKTKKNVPDSSFFFPLLKPILSSSANVPVLVNGNTVYQVVWARLIPQRLPVPASLHVHPHTSMSNPDDFIPIMPC